MAFGNLKVDTITSSTRTIDVDNILADGTGSVVTYVQASGVSPVTVSGGPITTSGTFVVSINQSALSIAPSQITSGTLPSGVLLSPATQSSAGSMSASDKTKLDGIAAGAEVNVNADWNAVSGDAQILNKPSLGTSASLNVGTVSGTVAAGNDARFHDAVTLNASVADVLNLSGQELQADDPGGDRLLFWDDSEGKLTHATLGPGVVLDGTTLRSEEMLWMACSDETTALTAGAGKLTFRMPYAATLLAVRANVKTAPTGANLVVDVNEAGISVLSTKLSIDASETSSTTAATPAVISDSSLADDAEMTIDIDQVGSSIAGAGLKVGLYVRRV